MREHKARAKTICIRTASYHLIIEADDSESNQSVAVLLQYKITNLNNK